MTYFSQHSCPGESVYVWQHPPEHLQHSSSGCYVTLNILLRSGTLPVGTYHVPPKQPNSGCHVVQLHNISSVYLNMHGLCFKQGYDAECPAQNGRAWRYTDGNHHCCPLPVRLCNYLGRLGMLPSAWAKCRYSPAVETQQRSMNAFTWSLQPCNTAQYWNRKQQHTTNVWHGHLMLAGMKNTDPSTHMLGCLQHIHMSGVGAWGLTW